MPASAASISSSRPLHDALPLARQIIEAEANTLLSLADLLSDDFARAVKLLLSATGAVVVSGMGKAGHVGQKIAATLCSTGTRSYFLHPAEAIHGDLGRIHKEDIALVLSASGETEEIVRLRSHLGGLRGLLDRGDGIGKRIDFLLQEVQREVNTVAAKSSDLRLTQLAVEAKGEVEKIREQVQNIE